MFYLKLRDSLLDLSNFNVSTADLLYLLNLVYNVAYFIIIITFWVLIIGRSVHNDRSNI